MWKNEITFRPSYYEWVLIINGKVVYAFDDLAEYLADAETVSDLEGLVDGLYDTMMDDLTECGKIVGKLYEMLEINKRRLTEIMTEQLAYHYGIG